MACDNLLQDMPGVTLSGTMVRKNSITPAVGKCNTETNYGWNWKVTSLFCLNNHLAEGLSAEVDTVPKCSYSMISFDTWTGERWTTSFFGFFFLTVFTFNLPMFFKEYRENRMLKFKMWMLKIKKWQAFLQNNVVHRLWSNKI